MSLKVFHNFKILFKTFNVLLSNKDYVIKHFYLEALIR